ncbi:acyltransferase family protein [Pseudomonas neuropathica]|uniref:Acyltransferase family protein n=1 Tax=Pseudomonas neuropathica TaxID=2730425 RepID=A0ACC7MSC1_9PSED
MEKASTTLKGTTIKMPTNVPALTGVRGFAALWVVLMHYTWVSGYTGQNFFDQVTFYGFAGVTVFLVLSGFMMAHAYPTFRETVSVPQFAEYFYKRIVRIYPLHLATIVAFLILVKMGYPLAGRNDTDYTLMLNLFLVHAWGFVNEFSWNAVSWTISVEMFAYIWFPFVIFSLYRLPKFASAITIVAAVYVLRDLPYVKLLNSLGVDTSAIILGHGYYLFQFTSVFIAGVALYRLMQDTQRWPAWVCDAMMLSGIAVLLYACTVPFETWRMMCGSLLIVGGLLHGKGLGNLLFGNRASVFLGDISYSLYLTHFMLGAVLPQHFVGLTLAQKLAAALVIATISYYVIERPSRDFLRKLWKAPRKVAVA